MRPKIVLIGVGRFGNNHLRNLIQLDKKRIIKLNGVIDSDQKIRNRIKNEFGINTGTDFKSFIEDTDAFDIVTPAFTHYSIAKYLINKQKHVFVEKPLSMNSVQAKKLVQSSKKNKCIIQVGHIFRYNKAVEYIKQNLKQKDNFPYYIKGNFTQTTKPKSDVGAIFNYLHHFDILDNILRVAPTRIFASSNLYSKKPKLEINSTVFLQYSKGLNIILDLGWIPSGKYRTIELYSKKQYMHCDLEKQIIKSYKNEKLSREIKFTFKEPLALELNEFVNCIKTGKQPTANADVGYRIVRIAELATRSAQQTRVIMTKNI